MSVSYLFISKNTGNGRKYTFCINEEELQHILVDKYLWCNAYTTNNLFSLERYRNTWHTPINVTITRLSLSWTLISGKFCKIQNIFSSSEVKAPSGYLWSFLEESCHWRSRVHISESRVVRQRCFSSQWRNTKGNCTHYTRTSSKLPLDHVRLSHL